MDAIESGIVKIHRSRVADDSVASLEPTFRDCGSISAENFPGGVSRTSGAPEGAPIPKQLKLRSSPSSRLRATYPRV